VRIYKQHGRAQKFFQWVQRRHFAYLFQFADDAMKIDVHKTVCLFYTTKKRPHVTAAVTKMRSFAGLAGHESRKDFFQGGKQSRISRPPYPQLEWGHAVKGVPKFSPVAKGGFCGFIPQTKFQLPKIEIRKTRN